MSQISEATLGAITYRVDHGLIILEDPDSKYQHDDWDASSEFVSVGQDSVYLSVQPAVDGPIELVISKSEAELERAGNVYFDGQIQLKSRYVVVRDADDMMRFSVRRPQGINRIRVMVDEPGLAAVVHIMFLPA